MIFVVFSIKQDGKQYAIADTIKTGENLLSHCRRYNSDICHLCESRKEADQIAIEWNRAYKENDTSIFA